MKELVDLIMSADASAIGIAVLASFGTATLVRLGYRRVLNSTTHQGWLLWAFVLRIKMNL